MNPRIRTRILFATLAIVSGGILAGCAPATGLTTPGSSAAPAAGVSSAGGSASGSSSGGSSKPSCDEFTDASFKALVNVAIGTPYIAGSDSAGGVICWYGIGSNAAVTGSKIETLDTDTILITTTGIDGESQFAHFTGSDVNSGAVVPISGIGDKAAYNVSALSGNVPQLYSYKGDRYCGVNLSLDPSELVDAAPEATAKSEGGLCEDAFKNK